MHDALTEFPRTLSSYPALPGQSLWDILQTRIQSEPFNLAAALIFLLAILHTFFAPRFASAAHREQRRYNAELAAAGRPPHPSVKAEILHFLGEVEVVFGLWALPLMAAIFAWHGWHTAVEYVNSGVNYTEPLFVVVIMALASTRPIITLAEDALRQFARLGGATAAAWWVSILMVAPLLGSFITEPAAMTIAALLLAKQFFDLRPSMGLRYATLGLLFVNVSIGGTLTHFAAPPVLIVAREWAWSTPFMLSHFGWRAVIAVITSTTLYYLFYFREFRALANVKAVVEREAPAEDAAPGQKLLPVPKWVTIAHICFMVFTVMNSHYPALFLGGFLFFLGFAR
ncbi:MAG: putative Na+/H+ antiporter, partial [Acidobacteriota bacterium]